MNIPRERDLLIINHPSMREQLYAFINVDLVTMFLNDWWPNVRKDHRCPVRFTNTSLHKCLSLFQSVSQEKCFTAASFGRSLRRFEV